MPARYEWKTNRNGTRRYVRTFVADAPAESEPPTSEIIPPEPPVAEKVEETVDAEPEAPSVEVAEAPSVEVSTGPVAASATVQKKTTRRRKATKS